MQSPDSSLGSSSYDLLMAAPATTTGRGASSSAIGMIDPRIGYIPVVEEYVEEYNVLKEWADNYRDQTRREQATAMAQMRHLVGANNEYKMEASECRQDNFCMQNELHHAKMLMQSERNSEHSI